MAITSDDAAISNIYSAKPAFPVLASSLLPSRQDRVQYQRKEDGEEDRGRQTTWDLMEHLEQGLDGNRLFRTGITVGFSYLKECQAQCKERVGEIPRKLLSSLLLRYVEEEGGSETRESTKAFIIHPTQSRTFAPETLLQSILDLDRSSQREESAVPLPRDRAITLLDDVQLLAVYDFASAVQAISQVADALYSMARNSPGTLAASSPLESRVLFIIEGLDALAENVIRTSNPLRGSALMMPALRTMTHLSRTYASFLSVMLVNTAGLGPAAAYTNRAADHHHHHPHHRSSGSPIVGEGGPRDSRDGDDGGLHSIFARHAPSTPSPLLQNMLSRTLDQGIDTHLMLSTVKRRHVVEVIKDRTGDGVGKWCFWE